MNPIPYRELFTALEQRLIEYGSERMGRTEIRSKLDNFKTFAGRQLSDEDYFWLLVRVTFYSGFKASTVTSKLPVIRRHFPSWNISADYTDTNVTKILADPEMIRREPKIRACISNAKTFRTLIGKYGSFKAYIDSYAPNESFENLLLFKESLEASFEYLGGVTVYHFMTDIGLPVLKPDRVIARIFTRLGLLESTRQLLKAVLHGQKFAKATGHPIRYVDIVFVAYGQASFEEFGIERGICLDNPRCEVCGIQRYCTYYATHLSTQPTARKRSATAKSVRGRKNPKS